MNRVCIRFPFERTDITSIEDDVTQVGQGILPDRSQEHLGATDVPIILSRNIWLREMKALAEERPLMQWQTPPFPQRDMAYGTMSRGTAQ